MEHTSGFINRVDKALEGGPDGNPRTVQGAEQTGTWGAGQPPRFQVRDNTNENTGSARTEMQALGVHYAVPYDDAVRKGLKLEGLMPAGRAGAFVYERAANTASHKFVAPAVLPESFRIRSTMIEQETEVEGWRTDLPQEGVPAVFPNLDIILFSAGPSPALFVQNFIDYGWSTSEDAVGPLAQTVRQHLHRPAVQTRPADDHTSREVLIFDALLSFAQFAKGRQGDTLWMGCPVLPHQLLAVIQKMVAAQTGPTWVAPALDQTVSLIGGLTQITDQARSLARNIVFMEEVDWSEVQATVIKGEEMKAAIELFTSMPWGTACQTASSVDLTAALNFLSQRYDAHERGSHPDRRSEGWRIPSQGLGQTGLPTFVLAREPSEDEPRLTPTEKDQLEDACKSEQTTEIDISRARLLTEATGSLIVSLQPGGPDISRVKLGYFAENLIMKVHEEIATVNSLRKIPLVTLAKVFSLRMTPSDNFVYEHLGLLINEDLSTDVTLTKMRGSMQGGQVVKAKKHLWATVSTVEDLANIAEGLAKCSKRFHHPSILNHAEITDLWAELKQVYVEHGGHALVSGLFLIFKARMEEHALAVRSYAQSPAGSLPPLQELQGRSRLLYNNVCDAARQECLRDYTAMRTGTGETAYAAQRDNLKGIDAEGRQAKLPRRGNAQAPTGKAEGNPSTATDAASHVPTTPHPRRSREGEADAGQGRAQNKRPKRPSTPINPCVRCAKPGHEWYKCNHEGWCIIPHSWPSFLRSLAAKVRSDHGIQIIMEPGPVGTAQREN